MKILTTGMRKSRKGPAEWFTGTVWIDEIVTAAAPSTLNANRVSFEPGARTAWHTHPMGQALHVVAGLGRVQLKGRPPQEIGPGDSVWIRWICVPERSSQVTNSAMDCGAVTREKPTSSQNSTVRSSSSGRTSSETC